MEVFLCYDQLSVCVSPLFTCIRLCVLCGKEPYLSFNPVGIQWKSASHIVGDQLIFVGWMNGQINGWTKPTIYQGLSHILSHLSHRVLSDGTNTFLILHVRKLKPGNIKWLTQEQSSNIIYSGFELRSSDSKSHSPLSQPFIYFFHLWILSTIFFYKMGK